MPYPPHSERDGDDYYRTDRERVRDRGGRGGGTEYDDDRRDALGGGGGISRDQCKVVMIVDDSNNKIYMQCNAFHNRCLAICIISTGHLLPTIHN